MRAVSRIVPNGKGQYGRLHVAMTGKWEGHPAGPFSITARDMDAIIERFNGQKTPMAIDYDHSMADDDVPGPKIAAGWIHKMSRIGDDLWAEVEWTPRAAEMIRNGEYAFCSPVMLKGKPDRVTGKPVPVELFNVALTNTPFLDGQTPITLSRIAMAVPPPKAKPGDDEQQEPQPKPQAQATEQPAQQETEQGEETAQDDDAEAPEEGGDGALNADADPQSTLLKMLSQSTKLDEGTLVDLITRHIDGFTRAVTETYEREQANKANEKGVTMSTNVETEDKFRKLEAEAEKEQLVALSRKVEALEADAEKLRTKAEADAKAALEARVDGLIKSGHVLQSQREDAIWAFTADPVRAERIYAMRQVPKGQLQAGAEERIDPEKATEADLAEHERSALAVLMSNNPTYRGKKPEAIKAIVAARGVTAIRRGA